jgi:hypothetical protein
MAGNSRWALISWSHSLQQDARQHTQQATAIPVKSSASEHSGGRVGKPSFKLYRHIMHYVRLKAALSRKLTVRLSYSLTLSSHNSSRGHYKAHAIRTRLKSFTINKRPNVHKIYNKRVHSHLYSILTTNWYMANCMQDTQQINTWPIIFNTYKKTDTLSTVFNTQNKQTHG